MINNMKKKHGFRAWFYLRTGWSQYFAFVFAAINTLTVTYFLLIDKYPFLKSLFPTFAHYIIIISSIALPILIVIGYIHFKRIPAFSSEVDIVQTSSPYTYKLTPGWMINAQYPLYLLLTKMMLKMCNNEKFSEEEIKELTELQKKIETLLSGGSVGQPPNSLR